MSEYKHNLKIHDDEEGRHFTEDGTRVYTKAEAIEVKHIPLTSQPMLNGWMREGKVKVVGYGPVTPGSHNERVYLDAMSVDLMDYEPSGPRGIGGEEEWSFRIGKATLALAIKCIDDHKARDEGGQKAEDAIQELLKALSEAHSLTEARRVYNQLKKNAKK